MRPTTNNMLLGDHRSTTKMKVSKRQLRRIIREYTRDPMERSYAATVENYEAWVQEMGHITPSASSVLATYLVDKELDTDAERISVLTSEYKLDPRDVKHDINRQLRELGVIEEAEGSTKKYDDDSALKGGQSKLPDGLQKGIIDKTVEDREEDEEEERKEKNESVRITKRQLRRIISDSILVEAEMLKIMDNPYEDLSVYNRIANYALTNDIAGAMADPEVNTDELYWELDDMKGWIDDVGTDSNAFTDDSVVPPNWNADAVYEFMGDLESAWHKDQAKKDHAAVAGDPDKGWLKFMANEFQSVIVPNDLESLGWKEYKKYIRLSPPESISHAADEIHITNDDFSGGHSPGTREEFVEFLTNRAGKTLKKRKIYRSPPPLYD